MTSSLDQAFDVRDEDRLDAQKIDAFLKQHVPGLTGAPTIRQFPGGASNLTYLISYAEPDSCDPRELVLRKPPAGVKAKSAHDMLREARIMAALKPHYPFVPAILACCDDHTVLGSDFYVMERLRGIILRRDLPADLGLDEAGVRQLCLDFINRLVQLHQVDKSHPDIAAIGKGEGYIGRQVTGWSERWRQSLTEDTDAGEDVTAWIAAKQPAGETAICVIHNDYRFDNVVLGPTHKLSIVGVLDWEMTTLGDPMMDLGGSLAYWVQADDDPFFHSLRRQPSHVPGMLTRRELVAYYSERSGWRVDNFDFYEVFGLFRLMVIIQQIYRRFVLGQTTNPRFADFGQATAYLLKRCRRLIRASTL
jgi:aminoglycoside phosphotransferase (APT) family kinase protein